MTIRNPKQAGSNLYDCRPQVGKCPIGCSQCFYNRESVCEDCSGNGHRVIMDGTPHHNGTCHQCYGTGMRTAFYCDINTPNIPDPGDVGDNNIVSMNCGHDSNLERGAVIDSAGENGRSGRLWVQAFTANGTILNNQEDFTTVDTVNEEIISTNHTLIVGDPITFTTSAADLPDPLVVGTQYWVETINVSATGRFTVSLTDGGAAIDLTDNGTGTHIHHLTYQYVVGGAKLWNTSFGGAYNQSSDYDGNDEDIFRVRDEVKYIDVFNPGGANVNQLRRLKIYTLDRHVAPRTWNFDDDFDEVPTDGRAFASAEPVDGVYQAGQVVWNITPAGGDPLGWICTVTGAPGIWVPMSYTSLNGSTTFDPASLVDGAGETTILTVTGAALGDFVQVSAPYDLQDITVTGYVQAANNVEIRLQNESTGTVDLASGTWRVKVTSP